VKESDLLAHIQKRSANLAAAFGQVVVGPGDDCAVIRTPRGDEILLTVDHLVEGRHFEPGTPIDLIARKAVARSVSDIAAMGGTPAWGLATGCLPRGYAHADELFEAMHKWANHWGCPLVGGDISTSSGPMVLTVTVGGTMVDGAIARASEEERELAAWPHEYPRLPIPRSGACPGDALLTTGVLGGSLGSGHHLRFEPRVHEARRLHMLAGRDLHAMIDISDGLGRDGARLARASGVVLEIDASRLPLREGVESWRHAVRDGEDYELLFLVAPSALGEVRRVDATRIGTARAAAVGEQPGAWVNDPDGGRHDVGNWGWDHE